MQDLKLAVNPIPFAASKVARSIKQICLVVVLLAMFCGGALANENLQTITISATNSPIEKVLQELKKQTGYYFLYNNEQINKANPVTINIKNARLDEALAAIFKDQPFTYSIVEKLIVIKEKPQKNSIATIDRPGDAGQAALIDVRGQVLDEAGKPLENVNVTVKGSEKGTVTNNKGEYFLEDVNEGATLVFSMVGYETRESRIDGRNEIRIQLKLLPEGLEAVTINTGYQKLPPNQAAGSFELVKNKEVNRRVSTDILSRLEGVTNSLLIDRRGLGPDASGVSANNIIIRGLSTLTESIKGPLVVVDNFPYDGDINNINPNDVETISILRDASAASIWGARAGNGVIVITTRQGKFNQRDNITFSANVNLVEKPRLFKYPRMSSSDFIGVEEYLFDQGFFDNSLDPANAARPAVSPVVEIFDQLRAGTITADEAEAQINALRNIDVRNDFDKYIYRTGVNQQYALGISGGTQKLRYSINGGFDKNLASLVGDDLNRITFRTQLGFTPIKNLELHAGVAYTNTKSKFNSLGNIGSVNYNFVNYPRTRNLYPYARFADENGAALALPHDYRIGFVDTAGGGQLLDWKYRLLDEIANADNSSRLQDIVLRGGLTYKILPGLSADLNFQYENAHGLTSNYHSLRTYYARNLINLFTNLAETNLDKRWPVPSRGGILYENNKDLDSYAGRMQVNFNRTIAGLHAINAIAGGEIRESILTDNAGTSYGYNKETLTSAPSLDYVTWFPLYMGLLDGSRKIPGGGIHNKTVNRFVSAFANLAYTYNDRYTVSLSGRRDASNLFGANTNDKWKPLWSVGGAWTISNESFYKSNFIPYLRLRATYGYQGNVNNTLSRSVIIARSSTPNQLGLFHSTILAPADPNLTWETIGQLNVGVDFSTRNNRISGSVELYNKESNNLVLSADIDPTTGLTTVVRNSASIRGNGVDVNLQSLNIDGAFKWNTYLSFSYVTAKVTDYLRDRTNDLFAFVNNGGKSIIPVKGYALNGLYSFPFAGLDPATGDPQGYLNKEISKDYYAIQYEQNMQNADLVYHGNAIPPYFGYLRNAFSYKGFTLEATLFYRFGYFFRKNAISYSQLFEFGSSHYDFSKRWMQAGDEQLTNIPSMTYPGDFDRDDFYQFSSINVLKGDHIRLQDIRLGYSISKNSMKRLPFQNIEVFAYANNLGIIWRANDQGLDPDYDYGNAPFPPLRSLAFGLRISY